MNGKGRGRAIGRGIVFSPDVSVLKSGNLNGQNGSLGFTVPITTRFEILCTNLSHIESLHQNNPELRLAADTTKELCETSKDLGLFVDSVYNFSLKSNVNAHTCAILCNTLRDLEVDDSKFKILLLRKFQQEYQERKDKYKDQKQFLSNVTFLCEVFHHMRVPNGSCYAVLVAPIVEYFNMLLDGGTDGEINTFTEQFQKCHTDLHKHESKAVDELSLKMREKIISKTLSSTAKATLLRFLEEILTQGNIEENVKQFYEGHANAKSDVCRKLSSEVPCENVI